MKKYLFFILFYLLVGCSSNPPQWYYKIHNDTNNYIYATGEGKNKQEAINSALANASSKIAIVVKSLYKNVKYKYKSNNFSTYSNNSIFNIETKTNPITFTDYKILKIEKKDKYYVLLRINRYKNANFMCNNITIPSINFNHLNIFFNYNKIMKKLNNLINKIKNINAIYPLCENKLKKIFILKNKINKIYNSLKVNINSNDENMKSIISSLIHQQISKKADITILAHSNTKFKRVGNYKIAQINIKIIVRNKNSFKNFNIVCASSSIQDYKTAKALAYNLCKEKIKKIFNN